MRREPEAIEDGDGGKGQSFSVTPHELVFRGPLTRATLPDLWPQLLSAARNFRHGTGALRLDAGAADAVDGAGVAALARLARDARAAGRAAEIVGLDARAEALLRASETDAPEAAPEAPPLPAARSRPVRDALAFLGEAFLGLARPARSRREAFLRAFCAAGPDALPVTTLAGFLLGAVLAIGAAPPLRALGAGDAVAGLVGLAVVREGAMLVAAVVTAGRTASAFAAELGAMEADDETGALLAMGLSPVRHLAAPRIAAAAAALPLLGLFAGFAALFGAGAALLPLGCSWSAFWVDALSLVHASDLFLGLFKGAVFGLLVVGVGCHCGLSAGAEPGAVGRAASRAVAGAILAFALADGVFAVLFHLLGV